MKSKQLRVQLRVQLRLLSGFSLPLLLDFLPSNSTSKHCATGKTETLQFVVAFVPKTFLFQSAEYDTEMFIIRFLVVILSHFLVKRIAFIVYITINFSRCDFTFTDCMCETEEKYQSKPVPNFGICTIVSSFSLYALVQLSREYLVCYFKPVYYASLRVMRRANAHMALVNFF